MADETVMAVFALHQSCFLALCCFAPHEKQKVSNRLANQASSFCHAFQDEPHKELACNCLMLQCSAVITLQYKTKDMFAIKHTR
jgi:hypothetical protein